MFSRSPDEALLTVTEVAAHLREHRKTVLDRIAAYNAGDPTGLPAINLGGDGRGARWRIQPAALERWLQSRSAA